MESNPKLVSDYGPYPFEDDYITNYLPRQEKVLSHDLSSSLEIEQLICHRQNTHTDTDLLGSDGIFAKDNRLLPDDLSLTLD